MAWLACSLHEDGQSLDARNSRQSADPCHHTQGTLMCKENLDSIQGRLLVQPSPSQAYSTEKTVAHAKLYDEEFKQRGISRDRFCIKIPATGPGVIAMKQLVQEGHRSSLDQPHRHFLRRHRRAGAMVDPPSSISRS